MMNRKIIAMGVSLMALTGMAHAQDRTLQAHAAGLLTREQAENIAAQSIRNEGDSSLDREISPDTPLSQIKEDFLFTVLASSGMTSYCGPLKRPTWVIGINADKTKGWREGNGPLWNGGYPFLIDAKTGEIRDCRS